MAKKIIVVDRDGTIIKEPPVDYQVDSLEKLEFVPGAISALRTLRALDYDMVMATNQDGLGTDAFPTADFEPPHRKMLQTLAGEGVTFDDQLIDVTFEHDSAPTRKPRTGMFGKYLSGDYDLAESYVIGDRLTDMQLADNLGAKGILLARREQGAKMLEGSGVKSVVYISDNWADIAEYIRRGQRRVTIHRATRETDIRVTIDLDGGGDALASPGSVAKASHGSASKAFPGDAKASPPHISTGLHFLDHMLDQIAHHGGIYLDIEAHGDLEVDEHHTMEDVAIVLGEALAQALGNKAGIGRYGFALPMDESRAIVLLDFGGRIDLEWDVTFTRERVGDVPTEMFRHFFQSLCAGARCNMYVSARGDNDHHRAEAIFKALARALRMAVARNGFGYDIPSSKGIL